MRHSVFSRLLHGFHYGNADYYLGRGYSCAPKSVCLVLSHACNLKCLMCDIGRANADASAAANSPLVQALHSGEHGMQTEDWLRLVDQLACCFPKPLLLLTGAEPFLAPDWQPVAERILHQGLRLHITTNGWLLERCVDDVAAMCPHPAALDITVSLDGPGAVHDRIRGVQGTFERAIAGIHACAAAWSRRGWKHPPVHITCTISNHNAAHLEAFLRAVIEARLPVRDITFNQLWFRDNTITARHNQRVSKSLQAAEENIQGVAIAAIDPDMLSATIAALKKTAATAGLPVYFEPNLREDELRVYYRRPDQFVGYTKCTAAWRNIAITPAGAMILSPLCFLPPLGSVKDRDFRQVWNSDAVRAMRRKIFQAGVWPACARCCMLFGSKPRYHKLATLFR